MNSQKENELQQLYTNFINEQKYSACLRNETIRGYRAVFDLFIKVMPEVTSPDLLTTPMLNEFFKRIQTRSRIVGKNKLKTGVRSSTIKTHWSKLNVFFKWLKENNYIEENPLKGIKSPSVSYTDFKRLTNEEVDKLYSSIVKSSDGNSLTRRRDTMMISLLLATGVRKTEFILLKIRDIDLDKRLITVRAETSKSKKTRIIPIHPTLLLHLKEYIEVLNTSKYKTEYLIVSSKEDRGLSKEGLKHWVERMRKLSGVRFHLHQFRHTFACKLVEVNTNAFKIQKLMGHSDIAMTMRYVRSIQTQDLENDIEKMTI